MVIFVSRGLHDDYATIDNYGACPPAPGSSKKNRMIQISAANGERLRGTGTTSLHKTSIASAA